MFELAGEFASIALPKPDEPRAQQLIAIKDLSIRLEIDIALFDKNKDIIATTNDRLLSIEREEIELGWIHVRRGPHAWGILLPDQRWVVLRPQKRMFRRPVGGIFFIAGIALAIAIAVYPAVRGLTKRLERLQHGVETLGSGDLTARVKIEGKDEIARLASSFNTSAERIEDLVKAHRLFLASASHELRTPLSRLRVGIELLKADADPKRKADLEKDIGELDQLIDEILLASRLNSLKELDKTKEVDLLALVAEETSRYDDCTLDGIPVTLNGDARLLRRLIRNLLENAKRYGKPPVTVNLSLRNNQAFLDVIDNGDGLKPEEYQKIFDPFYRPQGQTESTGFGLGLSIVKQIAEQHAGTVTYAPGDNGKSCFRVELPV